MTIARIVLTIINLLLAFFSFATANPQRLSRTTCIGCIAIGVVFVVNAWAVWL
jgi:hypothetical protein